MHDFTETFSGRAATTEDFKATVEKHMTAEMQRMGSGKMDWFFDETCTAPRYPSYKLDYNLRQERGWRRISGLEDCSMNMDDKFRMLVPIYLELADGRIANLRRVTLVGNYSADVKVPFQGIKDTPRRAMVNYYDDVLASPN